MRGRGPGLAWSRRSALSAGGCVVLDSRGLELLVRLHGDVRTLSLGHVGLVGFYPPDGAIGYGFQAAAFGVARLVLVSSLSPARTGVDGADGARRDVQQRTNLDSGKPVAQRVIFRDVRLRHVRHEDRIHGKESLLRPLQRLDNDTNGLPLADEAPSAQGDGIRHQIAVHRTGQHHDVGVGADAPNSGDGTQSIVVGKGEVEQAGVRLVLAGSCHRLVGIESRRHDHVPELGERHAQRVDQRLVVVADEQPHERIALDMAGSTIRATTPPAGPGLSSKAPPQAHTRARVMVSPSELLVGTFPSPGPSSMTWMVTSLSMLLTSTLTCPPGPAARTALSSTQLTARLRATGGTTATARPTPMHSIAHSAAGRARKTQRAARSTTSVFTARSSAAAPMTFSTMSDNHWACSRIPSNRCRIW